MAAEAPPSHTILRGTGAPGSGGTTGNTSSASGPVQCTPELLYYHVVGHWPDDPEGTQGASGSSGDYASGLLAEADRKDEGGRKKRRKVPRKTKTSEIWFHRAELAFCTAVACIPPNGRTKIKFFGRPLGRNELIAAICSLATGKLYNRKQISSHSQVLKDKVPLPYKEIFTFEDKSRSGDEPGESATANVIENYKFPEPIYNIIGSPLTLDLANAEKPAWLIAKEAGDHPSAPAVDASSSRPTFWNNSGEYPPYYARGPPPGPSYPKSKDRDGRGPGVPTPASALDASSYYSYSQPLRHQETMPYAGTSLPPPHALQLLALDPQSPVNPTSSGESAALARRYGYSHGAQGSMSSTAPHSSRLASGSMWDGDSRSPTTSSQFDAQSGSSGVSPRQATGAGGSWSDQKPSISGDTITLPQLQDPGSQHNDWKWSLPPRSGVPSLAPLQSLTGAAASQSSGYGLSSPSAWSGSPSTLGYLPPSWNGDSRDSTRSRMFTPESFELSLQTPTGQVPLSSSHFVTSGGTIGLAEIYQSSARYGFLYQFPPPTVPVFHIDVPVLVPAERQALLQPVPELALSLAVRSLAEPSGWVLTTDSAYANPNGSPTSFGRTTSPLRPQTSKGDSLVATAYLMDLAALYKNFVQNDSPRSEAAGGQYDALTNFAIPFTALVQRVVRDNHRGANSRYGHIGSDLNEAACVFIYSFFVPSDPNARPICHQVVFDVNQPQRVTLDAAADSFVANLIAGEEADPSRFGWMSS